MASSKQILFFNLAVRVLAVGHHPIITASTTFLPVLQLHIQAASEQTRKPRARLGFPTNQAARPGRSVTGLCCKPDVGVSQIRTTTVLSSCFCVGQTVL